MKRKHKTKIRKIPTFMGQAKEVSSAKATEKEWPDRLEGI